MRNFANFLLFQVGWFVCVSSAADGHMWRGPLVIGAIVAIHLACLARPLNRKRELFYVIAVGGIGALLDTGLGALGATVYPTSGEAWPHVLAPPWIIGLWVLFATLPFHSLGWLTGRPLLAAVLGAVGGPLSYLAGARLGAVAVSETLLLTWGALAVEYGLVTPLLLRFARPTRSAR